MSEMNHQFHVGDWVVLNDEVFTSLNPGGDYYVALMGALIDGPHRIVKVDGDGWATINYAGCENIWFRPDALCSDHKKSAIPIDDLI